MISMFSAPTLVHQTQLKLSSKERATLPIWRPKRTVFCRQKSGLKTFSRTNAGMDIQRFRWKRTWYYSSVRDRRHGRRGASMVSSSMWEADWSKPNVLNEILRDWANLKCFGSDHCQEILQKLKHFVVYSEWLSNFTLQ